MPVMELQLLLQQQANAFCTMGEPFAKGLDFKSVLFTGGSCHQSTKNSKFIPPKSLSWPCRPGRNFQVPFARVLLLTLDSRMLKTSALVVLPSSIRIHRQW